MGAIASGVDRLKLDYREPQKPYCCSFQDLFFDVFSFDFHESVTTLD